MTKEELLARLDDIEWDDFEVKEASGGLPKSVWETVSAFSNTAGGVVVFGVRERKTHESSVFQIAGVSNAEKIEQDFVGTLRSRSKFNTLVSCRPMKFDIDNKTVLAFEIPVSPHKPVAIKSTGDVYIRTGSGDQLATDAEVMAIVRDSAFGSQSEKEVSGTSFNDVNQESIASYRSYLRDFNRALAYPELDAESFCKKLNIVTAAGRLTYGSLLMFGKRDSVLASIPNFWIDYMEVPGVSYSGASQRYIYRMPEQENIWESFNLIMLRLRNFVDAPYIEGPDIFGTEDNSQLFCIREGLVNLCAHSDYFAAAHPTVRVFSDRIELQNPGRFILDASEFRARLLSMPRNPSIIRFFRHPKLSENAGYGIDKMLRWKSLTGKNVLIKSDLLVSTVVYPLKPPHLSSQNETTNDTIIETITETIKSADDKAIVETLKYNSTITIPEITASLGWSKSKTNRLIASLKKRGVIKRIGSNKKGHWEISAVVYTLKPPHLSSHNEGINEGISEGIK